MIVGIGSDIVEIDRVDTLLQRQPRLRDRLFSSREQLYVPTGSQQRVVEYTAGRFAAKEAAAKALGTGIGARVAFTDIEIIPDERGKPLLSITPAILAALFPDSKLRLHVSISHCTSYALAYVVIEQL
ncbi:holo-ACP synthase [Brevibacillus humidisoli]|uniref:holo-ACP synthase n=1 Tax=Brevibacillus humidisoli TaxID=2895522 RepID=UPI001E5C48C6|nr:holo-ACP synthase [Brevibacillus humidisoli]UFJ40941.1 holo-ACP synthase [Brevibacillus humidisoli]